MKHRQKKMEIRNLETKPEAVSKQRPTTHIVSGLLVGAGIDQKTHTVRVTQVAGSHKRRKSALRVKFAASHIAQLNKHGGISKKKYGVKLCAKRG
jgi:hypothetical protein